MPASVAASEVEEEIPQREICDVDQLQAHGINKADVDKLRNSNYFTIGVCWLHLKQRPMTDAPASLTHLSSSPASHSRLI